MTQAATVALPKRLPLVIEPENRDESSLKDAKLVNGYVERSPSTDEYWIFKRPGLQPVAILTPGVGRGVYNWLNNIYSVFGTTLYRDISPIGTVDGTGGTYTFSSSLGTTPRLQLMNGVAAYNWDNATLVQISGANFPGNTYVTPAVKGIVYLDGSTFVLDRQSYIHGSDTPPGLNVPDQWTEVLNLLGAQIEPDRGVFLAKQLVYVLAMKEWSTEVFYNAQNPPGSLILGPVQGAKINYGCVSADSVQEVDGNLIWLCTNRSSSMQVVLLTALKPTIISTKAIERLLGEADFTTVYSFIVKYEGHIFYGLTLKANNITLVYDLVDKKWAQWTDANGNYFPIVSATYVSATHARILQHETNGKLYDFDQSHFTDDGAVIPVDIYTPNFDGGVRRRKQLNLMEFIGDQTTGSSFSVRMNDSDFDSAKWTNFRQVDMSIKRPVLTNCGTFVRRAFHIRHAAATPMRLQAVELQLDIGML